LAFLLADRDELEEPLIKRDLWGPVAALSRLAGPFWPFAAVDLVDVFAEACFGATSVAVTEGSVAGVSDSKFRGEDFVTFIIGPILGDKPIRINHTPSGANLLKTNGDWSRRKQTFCFLL
jgi:hypothetical protein